MSDFDPTLYKTLRLVGRTQDPERSGAIVVTVKSYADGEPAIKLERANPKTDGTEYMRALKGLNAEEAERVAPLLVEAAKALREVKATRESAPAAPAKKAPAKKKGT